MKLNILRFYMALNILLFSSMVPANNSYICQHKTGDKQFFGSEKIAVEREGKVVQIYQFENGIKVLNNSWSYEVVRENKSYGLQAIREFLPRPNDTPLDVSAGGILFLVWGNATGFSNNIQTPFLFVVSTDSDSQTVSSEVFSCK